MDWLGPVVFFWLVSAVVALVAFIFGSSAGLLRLGLRLLGAAVIFALTFFLANLVVVFSGERYLTSTLWHAVLVVAGVPTALTIVWVAGRWLLRERRHEQHELWAGLSLIAAGLVAGLVGFHWFYAYGGDSPVNASPPSISGRAKVGETLTADPGRWRPVDGVNFSYEWERCTDLCDEIVGAKSRRYALRTEDVGARIRVQVTATRTWSQSASSAATPRVAR